MVFVGCVAFIQSVLHCHTKDTFSGILVKFIPQLQNKVHFIIGCQVLYIRTYKTAIHFTCIP